MHPQQLTGVTLAQYMLKNDHCSDKLSTNGQIPFAWSGRPDRATPDHSFLTTGWAWSHCRRSTLPARAAQSWPDRRVRPLGHAHFPHFPYLHKWRQEAMCKVKIIIFS